MKTEITLILMVTVRVTMMFIFVLTGNISLLTEITFAQLWATNNQKLTNTLVKLFCLFRLFNIR